MKYVGGGVVAAAAVATGVYYLTGSTKGPTAVTTKPPTTTMAELGLLIEGAKKEGAVDLVGTMVVPAMEALLAGLNTKYSLNLKTSAWRGANPDVVAKLQASIQSNVGIPDVLVATGVAAYYDFRQKGQIMQYLPFEAKNVYDQCIIQDWAVMPALQIRAPQYNTKLVPDGITKYDDILNPKFKGLVAIGDAGSDPSFLSEYMILRQVLSADFFSNLGDLNPTPMLLADRMAESVASGEKAIAFDGLSGREQSLVDKGAPIKSTFPKEGLACTPYCMAILSGAPHPNAAKLLANCRLTEEGQVILRDQAFYTPSRKGMGSVKWQPPLDQLNLLPVPWKAVLDPAENNKYRQEWNQLVLKK